MHGILGSLADARSLALAETSANPTAGDIMVAPARFRLNGRRATQQMIATNRSPRRGPERRDAIRPVAGPRPEDRNGLLKGPRRAAAERGDPVVAAKLGSTEVEADVVVEGMERPAPVSFRRDVIPAFSQAGCNMGACHGTPTGKGGFRLSLRGYLPDQDYTILSREAGGRRINPMAAETSLILRKPLGEVPHEGGLRLTADSKTYEFLHDWIAEGAKDDPAAPTAVRLEVLPESRVLMAPASTQQLVVKVTMPTARRATSPRSATTTRRIPRSPRSTPRDTSGSRPGARSPIIAHYLNLVANVRLTHLVEVPGFVQTPRSRRTTSSTGRSSPSSTGCGSALRSRAPTASSSAACTST